MKKTEDEACLARTYEGIVMQFKLAMNFRLGRI